MAILIEQTPNPNAKKFSVGVPVGGPGTYVRGSEPEEAYLAGVLGIEGVASVFFTADFVTISKTPHGSWDVIVPQATAILESHFPE
ncbi:MAG TPA: NifU N-terminal domain-containing protein [Acidimicrobiia bacterium]|jgi:hypothetical protein